jgi:BTG family
MLYEIEALCVFWEHQLDGAPEAKITKFKDSLRESLLERCSGHWYPTQPLRGSATRSVIYDVTDKTIDPVLEAAEQAAGLSLGDFIKAKQISCFVDPGCVEAQLNARQSVVLYSA